MTSLKKLRIRLEGHVSTIPKSQESCRFNRLSRLESLSLKIFDLSEKNFEGLDLLTELEIVNNNAVAILLNLSHKTFKCLRNLRKLTLRRGFRIVDKEFLNNFPNLTCFRLEDSIIDEIEFSEHLNLAKLEIVDCDLDSTLPVFMGLGNLTELNLCKIDLYSLTNANAFNGLGNLIEFRFWSRIGDVKVEFDVNILSRMPKLKQIVLDRRLRKSMDLDLVRNRFPNLKFISFFENY
jgi:hypothetical protein